MKILVLNGPNLNLTGLREPEVYGTRTLDDLMAELAEAGSAAGHDLHFFQSNHEGALIDQLHRAFLESFDGVIYNPGAHAHYSLALRDAVTACGRPVVEVHLSNIHARAKSEPFRGYSVIAPACCGVVAGFGSLGYHLALTALEQMNIENDHLL